MANIFLVRHGEVVTPPITDDVLEGITRATFITLMKEELNIAAIERSIDRTELSLAEEAFLVGTGAQTFRSPAWITARSEGAGPAA